MKVARVDKTRHARAAGFSLLELLVVVAIIAVLTAYVAPQYLGSVSKSEVQAVRNQLQAVELALTSFRLDIGRFPTTNEGLLALSKSPPGLQRWRGPYLKDPVPPDPWGQPYRYRRDAASDDYSLVSLGKDGRVGGQALAADITR